MDFGCGQLPALAFVPLPQDAAGSADVATPSSTTPPPPVLGSPKASEAVDSTEDDYVMLDAADLILPLHVVPTVDKNDG